MGSASRPVVSHLGRAGDIAGGMTQVLNGYLAWEFPRVDVEVITSRGDPHDLLSGALRGARAVLEVLRLPRGSSVVVAHLSERGSFVREGTLLRLARARGLATVAHLHGSSFVAFAAAHPRLTASALRAADRVISLSEESSRVAARFVPPGRIDLIPNAIPSAGRRAKRKLVVFGGVVTHRKGIDVLQDAWERVAAPGWSLVIAGPIVDAPLVRSGLPAAQFRGPVEHEELLALLDEAAIAVLPSREEAMPMFILEAMARRACVISTSVGGIPAVLGRGEGIVVPPGEVEPFAAALLAAMSNARFREKRGDAALAAFRERFSAEAVFPRVESLWLAALGDARRRVRGARSRRLAPG